MVALTEIFKEIVPYGHFTWNDQNIRGFCAKNVKITDLRACIRYDKEVPIINVDRATKRLENGNTLEFLDEGRSCKIKGKNSVFWTNKQKSLYTGHVYTDRWKGRRCRKTFL